MAIQFPPNVRVMAVTKGRTIQEILPVLERYKIDLIGESRWQEAKDKLPVMPQNIEKHFIGHVQSNKVKEIIGHFDCIESVDSLKLLELINVEAKKNE